MGLTIGSDPEFMIAAIGEDGSVNLKSAIRVLEGSSKVNKLPISESQNAFYDNVLMEFNIAPAHSFGEFSQNWLQCLDFATALLKDRKLTLIQKASATFPEEEVNDEEASHFGCDPEYCIYIRDEEGRIKKVDPPSVPPGNGFRSCGGHIHIGHPIALEDPARLIKFMDGFVGVSSILLDHDESSAARRKLYGGAGTHRINDYGVEYRTLSNFWYASPRIARIIYRLTRLAVQAAMAMPNLIDEAIAPDNLKDIINNAKRDDAIKFMGNIERLMPSDLADEIRDWQRKPIMQGMVDEWNTLKQAA